MRRLDESPSMLLRASSNDIEKHDTPSSVPLMASDLLSLYLL